MCYKSRFYEVENAQYSALIQLTGFLKLVQIAATPHCIVLQSHLQLQFRDFFQVYLLSQPNASPQQSRVKAMQHQSDGMQWLGLGHFMVWTWKQRINQSHDILLLTLIHPEQYGSMCQPGLALIQSGEKMSVITDCVHVHVFVWI